MAVLKATKPGAVVDAAVDPGEGANSLLTVFEPLAVISRFIRISELTLAVFKVVQEEAIVYLTILRFQKTFSMVLALVIQLPFIRISSCFALKEADMLLIAPYGQDLFFLQGLVEQNFLRFLKVDGALFVWKLVEFDFGTRIDSGFGLV